MVHHLTATECHLPYGITQCYVPPDTSEHTPPSPRPVRPVFDLPTPEGWKAELTLVTCYIWRWFTRPHTVTHPSTNRARCRLTSLIKPTPLTTTPRRHRTARNQRLNIVGCRNPVDCGGSLPEWELTEKNKGSSNRGGWVSTGSWVWGEKISKECRVYASLLRKSIFMARMKARPGGLNRPPWGGGLKM